jgi:hypothetical protein
MNANTLFGDMFSNNYRNIVYNKRSNTNRTKQNSTLICYTSNLLVSVISKTCLCFIKIAFSSQDLNNKFILIRFKNIFVGKGAWAPHFCAQMNECAQNPSRKIAIWNIKFWLGRIEVDIEGPFNGRSKFKSRGNVQVIID